MIKYYGCHISIKDGIIHSIEDIIKLKGNMIQIFISNPMSTRITNLSKKYTDDIIENIKQKLYITNTKIVIHLPYVINLSRHILPNSSIEDNWWIEMICNQLEFSEKINSLGCVVHVGKHLQLTEYEGIENMYNNLKIIIKFLRDNNMKTHIILETAAGQGTELLATRNNSINNLAEFYNKFDEEDKNYLRLCIDTCHIFSAGYDLNAKNAVKFFFKIFDNQIGLRYIDLIHLNDSKTICGGSIDRHANLGQGKINIKALKKFIKYSLIYNIPIILETPDSSYEEIKIIRSIAKKL